jgi:hypothetical protein
LSAAIFKPTPGIWSFRFRVIGMGRFDPVQICKYQRRSPVSAWQGRGPDATYAILFFDAIGVKIRN